MNKMTLEQREKHLRILENAYNDLRRARMQYTMERPAPAPVLCRHDQTWTECVKCSVKVV